MFYFILFSNFFFRKCKFDLIFFSKSINMIILKFIINNHNYWLSVYYNYNDNQLYIYVYSIGIIYLNFIIIVKILM